MFRSAAVAVVLVAALAATGCAPDPAAPHTPAPTSTPLFASDEEALAAAEEAYAAYVSVTDKIFQDGGSDLSALSSVTTGKQLAEDSEGFEDIAAQGYRSIGSTRFADIQLQHYSATAAEGIVVVYLCEDISDVDVFDPQGVSVVQPDRPDLVKFEVTFDRKTTDAAGLVVANRVPWGDGVC